MKSSSKVGAVILATDQGLGYLAKAFFDHGIINKVYIHQHSSRTNHRDWYPREHVVHSKEALIEECDTIFFIETPFDWKTIVQAREKGKKTVLMPMYECTNNPLPYVPDIILTPSALDQRYFPTGVQINVPVEVPWKLRSYARIFVHNSGNGGLGGRNGTRDVLEAWRHVKSDAKLIVRCQGKLDIPEALRQFVEEDDRISIQFGTVPEAELFAEGDVFIFPEKFNGLSLPLQEAFASGMLVMCGDRFPMNTWLPKEPLIPVATYKKERLAIEFDSAQFSPLTIAEHVDKWYNSDIAEYSKLGKAWAEQNSWTNLKPLYQKLLA